jgi:hypothetical protein
MANREIGQISFEIGGVEYTLTPSFTGITEMEDRANTSILQIAREISTNGGMKTKQVVSVLWGGIIGSLPDGHKLPLSLIHI